MFGTREEWRGGDPVQYIDLSGTEWSPRLRFQRVPEVKSVKDRIHLDLRVDDIDEVLAGVFTELVGYLPSLMSAIVIMIVGDWEPCNKGGDKWPGPLDKLGKVGKELGIL